MDPLAFLNTVSSVRAGLPSNATITAQTALLPTNINIGGSLSVAGEVTNNVTGALSLRAYDDTGLYAASTLTIGNPLPAPLTTKPILEQQVTSLNLTAATFGTVSAGYSLKINGYVQPPATGTYLFRTTYRDGASLVIATRKLLDSWLYAGTLQQSVGTITLYQNIWSQFAMEHTVGPSGSEKLLVEWCNPGGTYTTLQTGSFTFAYDMKEVPPSFLGTTYVYGKANFSDTAIMTAGANLPNATYFSGNTSELNNDVGYLKSGFSSLSGTSLTIAGTISAGAIAFAGTTAGTFLQFNNVVSTVSGTVTTTAYGAFGVSPGTALDRYAMNAHRWWMGSSGTSSGTVGMQLASGGLSLSTITVGSVLTGNTGSNTLNVLGSSMFTGIIHQPNIYALQLIGANNNNFQSQAGSYKAFGPGNFTSVAYAYPNSTVWGAANNFPNNVLVIPQSGFYSIYVGFLLGPSNGGNDMGIFLVQSNVKFNFMHQTVMTPTPFNYASSIRISAAYTGYFQANEQLTFYIYTQNYGWNVGIDQNSFVSVTQVASL